MEPMPTRAAEASDHSATTGASAGSAISASRAAREARAPGAGSATGRAPMASARRVSSLAASACTRGSPCPPSSCTTWPVAPARRASEAAGARADAAPRRVADQEEIPRIGTPDRVACRYADARAPRSASASLPAGASSTTTASRRPKACCSASSSSLWMPAGGMTLVRTIPAARARERSRDTVGCDRCRRSAICDWRMPPS